MIDINDQTLFRKTENQADALLIIYQKLSYILIPLFIAYLCLEYFLDLDTNVYYKGIIIYSASFMTILLVLSKIKVFKDKFHYAHTVFLSGVLIISLIWFYQHPGYSEAASLLFAATVIGVVLINPRITLWFYIISFSIFIAIAIYTKIFYPELTLIYLVGAIVVTVFNYWRNSYDKNLLQARKTYQQIFDTTDQQTFVLSEHLAILDLKRFR